MEKVSLHQCKDTLFTFGSCPPFRMDPLFPHQQFFVLHRILSWLASQTTAITINRLYASHLKKGKGCSWSHVSLYYLFTAIAPYNTKPLKQNTCMHYPCFLKSKLLCKSPPNGSVSTLHPNWSCITNDLCVANSGAFSIRFLLQCSAPLDTCLCSC